MLGFRSASPSPHSHRSHRSPRRTLSVSTFSTSSAQTITPSLFTRNAGAHPPTEEEEEEDEPPPPAPDRRPKLFFASARTGVGVEDVFAYVARRVVTRWEWEEAMEARTLHVVEASESTIHLDEHGRGRTRTRWDRVGGACCA
ncbi:hypothetical protein OF83DRAFT_1063664 [Amylostereum chailletii]|nr:hypothetical protein OF83DRAFT_1063664 [Amylostereum chailletii]